MRIVVFSPHRGDAALSFGLTIEHWLRKGHRVDVLNCFTRSRYAPFADTEMVHANDLESFVSALRKREDLAWAKLAGGKLGFVDLGLLDAPVRLACTIEDVDAIETRPGDRAVSRIAGAVAKLARVSSTSPSAVVLPLALGGHIDHRVIRAAALDSLAEASIPFAFYEDQPYAARLEDPSCVTQSVTSMPVPLVEFYAQAAQGDIAAAVQRKARIAECYDSQVDSQTVQQIADFCAGYGGRERLWANETWSTSALGS